MLSFSQYIVASLALCISVQALPQASPTSAAAAPAPTVDNTALIQQLRNAPTVVDRFKALLFQDGKLLPQEEVQKKIVFDFNGAKPAQANGKVAQGTMQD
jgi:hypothetical protein